MSTFDAKSAFQTGLGGPGQTFKQIEECPSRQCRGLGQHGTRDLLTEL